MADLTLTCPKCKHSSNVAIEADVDEFVCQHCGTKSPVIGDYETLGKTTTDPLIGQSIADWEVVQKVGEGGFGMVYKAIDKNLRRPVAIKVMLQSLSSNLEFVQKFYREAITAAALNHPNIVGIHRVGRDEQRNLNFLVMEFLEGRTLADCLEERGPYSLDEAVPIILQCADALAAAHDKNIVHRDIKPENIMMDSRGVVKITDFGLAKTLSSDQKSTKVMGTPHFMSPEQFEGKSVDGRTDIYSLGVTFYFLLTKAKPYKGENTVQIIYSILTQEPQPVTELAPEVPEEIWRIVRKMIAKDVNERFANFRDVRRDLLAFKQSSESKKMSCPACRAVNLRGRRFCMKCGASLIVRCPHCGREEPTGTRHCSECGSNIESLLKIRENLDRGEKLRGFGDLKKALGFYQEVLKIDPEHEAAASATKAIEESLQRLARRRSDVDEIVEKGRPEDALAAIEVFASEFRESEEVQNYAKSVRQTIVHRAVDSCVTDAEKARSEARFEDAIRAYQRALSTDPERSDVADRLRELEGKLAAVEENLASAEAALADGRHGDALRLAREVLSFRPDHPRATTIAEEGRRRIASVEGFVGEARDLLAANRFEDAIDRMHMAGEISPQDAGIEQVMADALAAKSAFEGRIEAARKLLQDGQFESAAREAAELLVLRSDIPAIVSLKKEAEHRLSEVAYVEETRTLLASARRAEEQGDLEGAIADCDRVLARDAENESATELRTRLEQKIAAVAKLREEAASHLAADEFGKGLDSLRQIQALRPGDEALGEEVRSVVEKQTHVERAVSSARALVERGRFEQAIEEVEKALVAAPKHGEAGRLKRDATKSLNAVRKHVADAKKRIESELFEEALRELARAAEAGAPEEELAEIRRAAQDGQKVLLKAEATHAFTLGEYEEAERLYQEVLALDVDDRDARKGGKNARKAIVRSEREGVFGKVLVSAVLLIALAFVQYRAVQGGSGILPDEAEKVVAVAKENEAQSGTDADRWKATSDEYQKKLDEERSREGEARRKLDEERAKADDERKKEDEARLRREMEDAERRRIALEEGQRFSEVVGAALDRGGLEGLTVLGRAEELAGTDLARRKNVDEVREKLAGEVTAAALPRLITADAGAALADLRGLESSIPAELAGQLGLPDALRFGESIVAAESIEDPEQRIAALRATRREAGGHPEVKVAREARVDSLINETVDEWVRVTGADGSWQVRAAAYARILKDETVKETILPDGTPLVRRIGAWREFAEAMGQAEMKAQRELFESAIDAYAYAAEQAREDSDRRAAEEGRENARRMWIDFLRAKVAGAKSCDSEEFYEQVIRPLSEMARALGLTPEQAFRLVSGE